MAHKKIIKMPIIIDEKRFLLKKSEKVVNFNVIFVVTPKSFYNKISKNIKMYDIFVKYVTIKVILERGLLKLATEKKRKRGI